MSETYRLLYPENRIVTSDRIMLWYFDAIDNGEVEGEKDVDAQTAALALEDAGIITLARVS